ncbi:transcription antitermination factor NusB [Sporolactobacillus terrae]|uniref:Transcription antitermination protein NusB n=1 Tax=Sporolactobacillus terrae TaxID=269673 RepID=A0A410D9H5_9BACL|nr:transcription antitermination factor NusB [Sporolactobacillus terrae]QAA22726.1 transcription antitermination factor NusB [Sporolactobacillus terrae]QAA25699.1 transcription antitermination factor NusB [Sporolactobacillus terrae]UAK17512.1 transcription antitermination factor NusB [Sporolactobacillus terrae]BBN99060.1 N utilization substance protein B [Sporolactobacillus terrae]
MNRREARQLALQALFQMTLSDIDRKSAIDAVKDEGEPVDPFVTRLLDQTLDHEEAIDQLISKHLKNWSLDRVGNIDKTILRLAVCEIMYFDDIPLTVSVNEAVELCKIYSDEQTRKFVNGVLSGISKEIETNC